MRRQQRDAGDERGGQGAGKYSPKIRDGFPQLSTHRMFPGNDRRCN
jgi:hypothetical protein